jgi:tetratricopeptide (TPR) repeat protein
MSTVHPSHEQLQGLVDGDLSDADRASTAAHLETCTACRGIVIDLERLRTAAAGLGPMRPPDHVWLEIAGQIHLDAPAAAPPRAPPRAAIWQWAGLAAALLIVTAGIYLVQRAPAVSAPPAAPVADNAPATGSVQALTEELDQALAHYDKAIAELEAIARDSNGTMDSDVAATLQRNLGAIDAAIAESRAALAADPESASARDSLVDALMQKVSVLQATVSLVNEMRRGNGEGAAHAAENLGRKS